METVSGYFQPAEWASHDSCWLAWPSHVELWRGSLPEVQNEFVGLCEAIADIDPVTGQVRGEALHVLVPNIQAQHQAQERLKHLPVQTHQIPFGDIWLRDTAPVFVSSRDKVGKVATVRFKFNGWGEKYRLPYDDQVASRIAAESGLFQFSFPWILEGGAIETDGEGTLLTSRQCLLNPNRNPSMNQQQIEKGLCEAYGAEKILWVTEGLINDHTDGHIDTIARFSEPSVVLCMEAQSSDDPNKSRLDRIQAELESMVDAKGRPLKIIKIPSPGAVRDEDGTLLPASYLNFYIANSQVVVPVYGTRRDDEAVKAIAACFPNRRTVGRSAYAILSGGGAFHCITQQQPKEQWI